MQNVRGSVPKRVQSRLENGSFSTIFVPNRRPARFSRQALSRLGFSAFWTSVCLCQSTHPLTNPLVTFLSFLSRRRSRPMQCIVASARQAPSLATLRSWPRATSRQTGSFHVLKNQGTSMLFAHAMRGGRPRCCGCRRPPSRTA